MRRQSARKVRQGLCWSMALLYASIALSEGTTRRRYVSRACSTVGRVGVGFGVGVGLTVGALLAEVAAVGPLLVAWWEHPATVRMAAAARDSARGAFTGSSVENARPE